jgi:predicted enzyme related to lactoylglutathione lyase
MRNSVFRGVAAGKSNIGFMALDVYGILQLEGERRDDGSRFLLNFDVDDVEEVHTLTKLAVESGARLVKEAGETSYGWFQSVLLDPEGNVFRINKVLAA